MALQYSAHVIYLTPDSLLVMTGVSADTQEELRPAFAELYKTAKRNAITFDALVTILGSAKRPETVAAPSPDPSRPATPQSPPGNPRPAGKPPKHEACGTPANVVWRSGITKTGKNAGKPYGHWYCEGCKAPMWGVR